MKTVPRATVTAFATGAITKLGVAGVLLSVRLPFNRVTVPVDILIGSTNVKFEGVSAMLTT